MVFLVNFSQTSNAYFKLSKLVELDDPWGASFLNDKELIITEKGGAIKILNLNSNNVKKIEHKLNILEHGQGGLLDILIKIILFMFLSQRVEETGHQALL